MRNFFSCWEKWQNSLLSHWLSADDACLLQFQNQPLSLQQKAVNLVRLRLLVGFVVQILLCLCVYGILWFIDEEILGLFFIAQALLLTVALLMTVGTIALVSFRRKILKMLCWCVVIVIVFLMAHLFEQIYILFFFFYIVLCYSVVGVCLGLWVGFSIIKKMLNEASAFLQRYAG